MSIQEIIDGCRRMDPKAQRALLDQHSDRLYAICIRYIGNRESAKDALQESLIRVFKYFDKYDDKKGTLDAWLNTITIRQCLKELSKKSIDFVELDATAKHVQHTEPQVLNQFNKDELLKLVADLPDEYRTVFNLFVLEGYSHKEIAQMTKLQESSSRSRLSRAKIMLRQKLESIKTKESWTKAV